MKSELLLPRHTGVSALDIWYQMQHKKEIVSPLKVNCTELVDSLFLILNWLGESEAKGKELKKVFTEDADSWYKVFTQFASINCTTNYGKHQIVELITYTLKK